MNDFLQFVLALLLMTSIYFLLGVAFYKLFFE